MALQSVGALKKFSASELRSTKPLNQARIAPVLISNQRGGDVVIMSRSEYQRIVDMNNSQGMSEKVMGHLLSGDLTFAIPGLFSVSPDVVMLAVHQALAGISDKNAISDFAEAVHKNGGDISIG